MHRAAWDSETIKFNLINWHYLYSKSETRSTNELYLNVICFVGFVSIWYIQMCKFIESELITTKMMMSHCEGPVNVCVKLNHNPFKYRCDILLNHRLEKKSSDTYWPESFKFIISAPWKVCNSVPGNQIQLLLTQSGYKWSTEWLGMILQSFETFRRG